MRQIEDLWALVSAATVCTGILAMAAPALGDTWDEIGYTDLLERLGEDAPTGAGVIVGQIEAPDGSNYGPNQNSGEFAGIDFTAHSGTPGNSSHATTVAKNFYGGVSSVAPDVNNVHLWEVNDWIGTGYLNYGSGSAPSTPPIGMRIKNHSYIGETTVDAVLLRRIDFAANAYHTLHVVGVNNGSSSTTPSLWSAMYHGLSVGLSDGNHGSNDHDTDGGPRMKPEIVAPSNFTSYATPIVSACAALLQETVATDPELSGSNFAYRPQVMKTILMTGATHDESWTNNPSTSGSDRGTTARPIDEIHGAGTVNIDRSHRILTGQEQGGSSNVVPSEPNIDGPGWDWEYVSNGESVYYRFNLDETAPEVIFTATWHRVVSGTFGSYDLPDIDLYLWKVEDGSLVDMVGEDAKAFESGNVTSESAVDNVEHLYIRGLAAGEYAVEMVRQNGGSSSRGAIAWWIPQASDAIQGDLNGDGVVDGADVGLLLALFGSDDPSADLNGDGTVDGADIGLLLANWSL